MKLNLTAYHSTSEKAAASILKHGFKIPKSPKEATTDGAIDNFFPCVFFARRPDDNYGHAVIKVHIKGTFLPFKARKGERWADAQHRLVVDAIAKGVDGVAAELDTIGIMVVNLTAVKVEGLL